MSQKKQKIFVFLCVGFLIASMVFLSGCVEQGGTQNKSTGKTQTGTGEIKTEKPGGEQCGGDAGVCPVGENKTPQAAETKTDKFLSDYFTPGGLTAYTASYEMLGKGVEKPILFTQYVKGNKMRYDMISETSAGKSEVRAYILPGKIYTCMKIAESADWMCFEQKEAPKTGSDLDKIDSKDVCYKYDGTQTILNMPAVCFKCVKGDLTTKTCVHPSKPLFLLSEITKAGALESRMIAKSIDLNEPGDSVFKLPAEPSDIGSIGGSIPT